MFLNFSHLKNFHSNRLYIKCYIRPNISHARNHSAAPKYFSINPNYPIAGLLRCYKWTLLKKCKIKDLRILHRNLSTDTKNFNEKKNSQEDDSRKNPVAEFLSFLIFLTSLGMLLRYSGSEDSSISWEEFKTEFLAKGEVKSLTVNVLNPLVIVHVYEDSLIRNQKGKATGYVIRVPDVAHFEEKLRAAEEELGIAPADRIPVEYKVLNYRLPTLLLILAVLAGLLMFRTSKNKKFFDVEMPLFKFTRYNIIDPLSGKGKGVKFSDVAGLKEAKTEIIDFVDYLKRPDVYRRLGAKVPKGALLLGPPGCGKTLLAKAVATEANVPFLSINGPEFIEIIGGLGAARVREIFRVAKKRIPCIIYIDEIDAIGKKRETSGITSGEAEQTLNQLLVEMDGVVSNEGIVLLASTNRADVLDKALLRPGRFDRHISIDLPTFLERQEIFEHHLKSIHLEHKPEVYSKRMAHLTPGFSGADIANVCNEAALHAARLQKKIVQGDDLEYAVERVVGGTEKRSSARTPEEKKMFAYYEAGRALVGWLSKYGEALLKITIVARTDTPAGWTHFAPNEKFLYSVEDLRGKMCMGLGGRVALSIFFNRVTTAGQKDLDKVTKLAYAQVRRFGMNENIGLLSFDVSGSQNSLKKPYSKVLGNLFDQEARRLVADAYKETEKLILENKDKLVKLAEELLVKETLNYDDVVKLIGPPSFEGKTFVEPLEFSQSLDHAVQEPENSGGSNDT